MSAYTKDRAWSDQYIPSIRRVVGPELLVVSPDEIDRTQAADLIVLRGRDMTIAARMRKAGYADRYPYDFTIRSHRESGAKTELAKFLEGWGDWMFYGHASTVPGVISRWWLIDLHIWRAALLQQGYSGGWKSLCTTQNNFDGTRFVAFDVRKFDPRILVASSHKLHAEAVA